MVRCFGEANGYGPRVSAAFRRGLCTLLLTVCASEPAAPKVYVDLTRRDPGRHYVMNVLPSGDTIRYAIFVPAAAGDPSASLPLVVAAHFGGFVTPWMGGDYADLLVVPAFREMPAVILAPDAASPNGWSAADEERVMWLARRVAEVYPVDPRKVVMTGYSAGGAQAWTLTNRHQDFFTAAVPMSARPRPTERPWRIPVRTIHSTADELIPIGSVEAYVDAERAAGGPLELHAVEGISHHATAAFVPALREAIRWLEEVWR
jgi:predicted peptidase